MSHTLATPSAAGSFRRMLARGWDDPDTRSVSIGIVGAILIHLLVWLLGPHLLRTDPAAFVPRPAAAAEEFNIELAPDAFEKSEPVPPSRFVETNPDAPENTPDRTINFGAQNQQVAQEIPTPDGKSDRPATEGTASLDTTQIVSGRLTQPIEEIEAVPEVVTPPSEAVVAPAKAEQNPLPGFEKLEGEDRLTYGSNVAKIPNPQSVRDRVEGTQDVPIVDGASATQPAIDPTRPRPRPQIANQQRVRPAVLADNKFGSANSGLSSWDAKWSNYGNYLQQFVNIVQIQWERILMQTRAFPVAGSTVSVKFILDDQGRIPRIVNVETTATEAGTAACISAITDRAPYGPWTEDMIAVLGQQQEMTFTFHYQ